MGMALAPCLRRRRDRQERRTPVAAPLRGALPAHCMGRAWRRIFTSAFGVQCSAFDILLHPLGSKRQALLKQAPGPQSKGLPTLEYPSGPQEKSPEKRAVLA